MNDNEKKKLDQISDLVQGFADNETLPMFLRWAVQVLFIIGSDSTEKSNTVGGLLSCCERAFNKAIERVRKSGDTEGAKKLESDKQQMIKCALQIDFAGALASVLREKLGKAGDESVIVAVGTPEKEIPTPKVSNPFAGRN